MAFGKMTDTEKIINPRDFRSDPADIWN